MKMSARYVTVAIFSLLAAFSVNTYASDGAPVEVLARQGDITISGIVKDNTGTPVIGATVIIKGSTVGSITGVGGEFSFSAPVGAVVDVSFIGYNVYSFTVAQNKTMYNVILEESGLLVDEIVVTAYGGRQLRSEVTTSIAKVDKEVFEKGFYANPAQALSGSVAGLRVQNNSADPSKAPVITLRGGTNFDGTGSPLYIIDGQVRDNMHHINPDDVESMEVMKDAGSTAIYGARANNGVILVTTKKGKSGSSNISFSNRLTMKKFNNQYNFLNAEEYLYWGRTAYQNAANVYQTPTGEWKGFANINELKNSTGLGTGNRYFADDGTTPLNGNKDGRAVFSTMNYTPDLAFLLDKGWQTMTDPVFGGEIIFDEFSLEDSNINSPAISQNYVLSFSGGNDKGSYYSSVSYTTDNGIVPNNYYKRLNFTFNGDYKIKDWLKSISGLKFSSANWNGLPPTVPSEANYFNRVFSVPPTMRQYNPDGELILGPNKEDANQLVNIDKFERNTNELVFDMSQAFEVDFYKDLSFRVNANWLYDLDTRESFDKDYLAAPGIISANRSTKASFERYLTQIYNAHLNYDKKIGDHSISAMAGMEYFDRTQLQFEASGSGAPSDDFGDLGLTSNGEGKRSINSAHSTERILSFIGRVTYGYKSKYLIDLVARQDGYSKLQGDNRFGFFPGVSAGWVFGKEDFMEPLNDVVSFAKLRASYGVNGNASGITPYGLQGEYGAVRYNGNVGYRLSTIPNPYLRWEKTNSFDIGLDMSLFENKVNIDLTYYNRLTKDKYADIPLATSSGVETIRTNSGELRNSGVELALNFRVLQKEDWTWNISVNTAYNKNTVVALPANGLENNRQNGQQVYNPITDELMWLGGYQQGQTPGVVIGYKADGIYQSWNDIPKGLIDSAGDKILYGPEAWAALSASEQATGLPITPGDVRWRDVNGDGEIDQYDQVDLGSSVPKWSGGISSSLRWKDISLDVRMDYALGFQAYDSSSSSLMAMAQGSYNTISQSMDTWTPTNTTAKYPRFDRADQLGKQNYWRKSSQFVYNSSYLSIREVALTYSLPQRIVEKINVQNASILFSAQNLGYITSNDAKLLYSPEYQSGSGTSSGGYAAPTTFVVGLNLTF